MGGDETRIGGLKPVGAVGDPPGGHATRDCCDDGPPKGQSEVGDEAEGCEGQPKYFALHEFSLEEWRQTGAWAEDRCAWSGNEQKRKGRDAARPCSK